MSDTRQRFVSVKEAALILHLSESDVRRRVKRGELTAETYQRPQGTVIRVLVDVPDDESDTRQVDATPKQEDVADSRQDVSAAIMALEGALTAAQQLISTELGTISRYAERIAELERENGRLHAAAEHLLAQFDKAEEEARGLRERAERPWWRRW